MLTHEYSGQHDGLYLVSIVLDSEQNVLATDLHKLHSFFLYFNNI
jgi:hypothetical protein